VWWAEWEIKPGDSLRRKIDQGIEGASYFMVLLTTNSLKSEWVQTELDAGMVKRIEGSCRLLPIILDLNSDSIPVTLRGLKWVRLEPYEDGLRELVNVCHEVETKPALGRRPTWTEPRLPVDLGLSIHAQRLAVLLAERSETGNTLDPILERSDILEALGISEEEAILAADELAERGWARRHLGRDNLGRISPEALLFFHIDPQLKGWNPEVDAHALAAFLVNLGQDTALLRGADQSLGWGPRRINPAASFLVSQDLAKGHEGLAGENPYVFYYLEVTPRTKRFASR
jgi:TIR domain